MRRAFTLVELLVAIAVIAVIAGILFAVFASVRESGRMGTCISNLHQWGLAVQMYRQDWDAMDPGAGVTVSSPYQAGFPPAAVGPWFVRAYGLDSPAVRYCPSSRPAGRYPAKKPYTGQFWVVGVLVEPMVAALERRGADYPLVYCLYHNPNPIPETNPTYATLRVAVVRLNQRVDVHTIKAYPLSSLDW